MKGSRRSALGRVLQVLDQEVKTVLVFFYGLRKFFPPCNFTHEILLLPLYLLANPVQCLGVLLPFLVERGATGLVGIFLFFVGGRSRGRGRLGDEEVESEEGLAVLE